MLVEMAIGDAYGAAFEFLKPQRADELSMFNHGTQFYKHPDLPIGGGRYTDDTQMTLAIAEHMLSGAEWTKEALADRFLFTFHRDARSGYSGGFLNLMHLVESGEELLANLKPGSTRSGAAMRVAPIGLYHSADKVLEVAALQAQVTHDSPEGIESAQAIALATHYLAHRLGSKSALPSYLASRLGNTWQEPWQGWVSVEGMPCARAAITALLSSNSAVEIMTNTVAFGGDVDTVAAMACFMASCSWETETEMTPYLKAGLENGPFGYDYLHNLDDQLFEFGVSEGAFS